MMSGSSTAARVEKSSRQSCGREKKKRVTAKVTVTLSYQRVLQTTFGVHADRPGRRLKRMSTATLHVTD